MDGLSEFPPDRGDDLMGDVGGDVGGDTTGGGGGRRTIVNERTNY
jgi:hypothetical protein